MGCRLCVNIKINNKILGNCYWQSSGYLDEALNILGRIVGSVSLSAGHLKKGLYSNDYLEEVVAIYDLFEGLGCYTIIPNRSCEEYNYLMTRRSYRFKKVKDVNNKTVKSNLAVPTLGVGFIGLTKEDIRRNEDYATYIIDIYIDKEIIDFSNYFGKVSDVKNIKFVELKSDIKKIKFTNLFKIGKTLIDNYNKGIYVFKYKSKYYDVE